MSRLFGIAGVQMSVVHWDADATFEKMSDVTLNICKQFPWVNMIVFHELVVPALVQFVTPNDQNWWKKNSGPVPGPQTDRLCQLAREANRWLIPGSMWEIEDGKMYNTSVVISPDGDILVKYRKMFPWLPYETGTAAGDQFCTFEIPGVGCFGLCICYDMWFPEVARTLAWMGAEVIIQPTLTPTSDRALELVMARANALFNQCYFFSINGVGEWGGGRSTIIDPDGRVLQEAGSSQTFITELIDLDHTLRTREYGTLGLSQTLKQLRDSGQKFPIYGNHGVAPGRLDQLGELKFHHNKGLPPAG